MANKFIYSHPANEVVQVATMEEPDQHIWNRFSQSTRTEDPQAFEICTAYQQHLAALARYPCQGFGPEDDGKTFEEGVGFALQICSCGIGHQCKVNPENYNKPCRIAVRIPDKGEVGDDFKLRWLLSFQSDKPFFINEVRSLLQSYRKEEISLSRLVEDLNVTAYKWREHSAPAYPAEFVEWIPMSYFHFVRGFGWMNTVHGEKYLTTAELYQEYLQSKK